jgi:enoyl-CoA hydratase
MPDPVLYHKNEHKAYITFNRPKVMNAMNSEGFKLLGDYFQEAQNDSDIRVIILSGTGDRAFCSGADLKETIPQTQDGTLDAEITRRAVLTSASVWKPIIAAVHGYCLAGGTEILEATDIRIASEASLFGLPEVKWSIIASDGSLVRLVRQIPYCRAMEILLTGEPITAAEARDIGLINKVVSQGSLMEEAEKYADTICKNGPIAVQDTKRAVLRLMNLPPDVGFTEEWSYARRAYESDDAKEGVRAFIEKRKPSYSGS